MPRPKAITAHPRRDEWEPHRRELFRLFIVEGVSVATIAKHMKQEYGFDKRPKDYEYRFKKWTLRRNLHEKELRSIESQLSRRIRAGRPSEIVVSGVKWPESVVLGRLDRHRGSWLPSEHMDVDPLPDFLARVQTPSPLMLGLPEWPIELPWLQFNQHFRRATLSSNTLARQPSCPRGQESLLVTVMRPYLRKSDLGCSMMREVEVDTLHAPRKMRAVLEVIAPQVHEGDHETTAEILHTGSPESLAVEVIRLFIYLETNDLVNQFKEITGCNIDFSSSANVMDFLRCTGFLTKANINSLGRSTDPTSQVFLRRLLYHSVIDENSLDILEILIPGHFHVNESVHVEGLDLCDLPPLNLLADQEYMRYNHDGFKLYSQTLLQLCCHTGRANTAHFLLDLGADPYDTGGRPREFSPLVFAASLEYHTRANMIANSLLSKQTRYSSTFQKECIDVALWLAIRETNTALVVKLISARKRLGRETICPKDFIFAAKYGDCDMIRLLVDYAPRSEHGFITLPEDILTAVVSKRATYSIEKVNYLLELGANPTVLNHSHDGIYSLILYCLLHWSPFHNHGEDHALELAETLRKRECPPEKPKGTSAGCAQMAALHKAIFLGYSRLVEYLLDWGVDIDFCIDGFEPVTSACGDYGHDYEAFDCVKGRSPLLTALENRKKGIAKMLLKRCPKLALHGCEQYLAMRSGDDPELVTMLLQAGSADLAGWKEFLEQANMRRNLKSIELLLSMGTDVHAVLDPKAILRAALLTGDHNKACKQIAVCGYDSRALFDAVLLSHTAKEYRKVVERLLETRPNTSNDGFEVRATAYAAIHHDMYLIGILMKSFGLGPWDAYFPDMLRHHGNISLSSWVPDEDDPGLRMHILDYAANGERYELLEQEAVIKTLLEVGVSADGMRIRAYHPSLAAQTWKKLIAAGADPDLDGLLPRAARHNMLAHVEVLCEAKVCLNRMHRLDKSSRTAVQAAVEGGSPDMLQLLLHYGADVDGSAGYYRGATCLQLAAGSGNIGLVRLLLDKGAKVNANRSLIHGRTVIEIAAENGRLDVLKLLLVQKKHLFHTGSERHQFIRAANFAETNGHEPIVQMLRQHIDWDGYDQQLFDGARNSEELCLDDMTQKVAESEKCNPHYWSHLHEICDLAGVDDIYDIDGIENWIGERIGEPDGTITPGDLSSDGKAIYMPENTTSLDTGRHQNTRNDTTVQDGETRNQIELLSNIERPAQLILGDHEIRHAIILPENMHIDPTDGEAASRSHALSLNPEWDGRATTLAPQAIRYKDNVPAWVDDLTAQEKILGALQHQPAIQNVSWESGMVLGEVLDGMLHVGDIDDDALDHNMAEDSIEGKQDQHFDWGFWDDQGIGRGLAD